MRRLFQWRRINYELSERTSLDPSLVGKPRRYTVIECLSAVIILCNAVVIGLAADYAMDHPFDPISTTLSRLELSFIVFYLIEMLLRICHKGRLYFTERGERAWNLFDMILVTQGVWEEIATTIWVQPKEANSLINLRLFRLLKLLTKLLLANCVSSAGIFTCRTCVIFLFQTRRYSP